MRLSLLIVLAAATAGQALAADAPAPAAVGAEPPICTTTTTVVRRGDVMLSSTSSTKCEDSSPAAQGGSFHPSGILAAPRAVAGAPAAIFGSLSLGGSGEELTLRRVPADWRVVESRGEQICHLVLNAHSGPSGFAARSEGCHGALARSSAWVFKDGEVDVLGGDGALIVKLTGDRAHLSGSTVDGDSLELQR
jgi:hypothetical protein